jgi:hypothetical protein
MGNLNDIVGKTDAPTQTAETPSTKTKISKEVEALELENLRLDAETKKLALEAAQLEIRAKKAQIQDLEESLAERELKRENKRQRSLTNGETLKSLDRDDKAAQKRCNHKKGGNGIVGVKGGRGDAPQHAILLHTFANGDTWVRCLRCGKTWKPPVERAYKSREDYLTAYAEYQAALNFQTNNSPSSSYMFKYSDNGEYYRQVTEHTTLR